MAKKVVYTCDRCHQELTEANGTLSDLHSTSDLCDECILAIDLHVSAVRRAEITGQSVPDLLKQIIDRHEDERT